MAEYLREIRRIYNWLGRAFTPGAVTARTRPSALSRGHSAILKDADLLNHWKTDIDGTQTRRALEICGRFGLNAIYGEDSPPLVDADQTLHLF